MATWKVTPAFKKSIVERNYFTKDGNTVMCETGWRWGEFLVHTEDDNPPDIEEDVDMFDCGYECEMLETTDGCWSEYDYDECDDETQTWLEDFLEEDDNSWLDLEEHGWVHERCKMIIACELNIEKVEE